jgi:hypothetical protein
MNDSRCPPLRSCSRPSVSVTRGLGNSGLEEERRDKLS